MLPGDVKVTPSHPACASCKYWNAKGDDESVLQDDDGKPIETGHRAALAPTLGLDVDGMRRGRRVA